jgi:rhodanese-related sulfurtransferase
MKKALIVGFSIIAIIGIMLAQNKSIPTISNKDFIKKQKTEKNIIILDVRTEEELRGPLGKIDGVIHIPLQELEKRFNELNNYKDKEINIICRTGNRSGTAAEILNKKGFNAINVAGGMVEYRQNGQ